MSSKRHDIDTSRRNPRWPIAWGARLPASVYWFKAMRIPLADILTWSASPGATLVLRLACSEFIEKLNKETNAGLADPKLKARLDDLGGIALTGSPADFGKLIADETEKWGKVVKFVGIKAD